MVATVVISTLVSPVVRVALQKLSSLATAEFFAFIGVKNDIRKLESNLTDIQQLLTQLTSSNSIGMENWLERLQAVAYDAEDLIDSWAIEYHQWKMKKQVRKLHLPFSTSKFFFQQRKSRNLREIEAEISEILKKGKSYKTIIGNPTPRSPPSRQTGSLSNNLVVSREEDKKRIIELLIPDEEPSHGCNLSFLPIVGMGGVGKTTLAQLIYQDEKVTKYFKVKTWVCVTNNFDMISIFREIVVSHMAEKNIGHNVDNLSYSQLQIRVADILAGKRFILVLDDLWNYNHVELQPLLDVLNLGSRGSKVLVTSRISEVVNIMGSKAPYNLQCLNEKESWSLFKEIAFKEGSFAHSDVEELEECGKEIVRKCSGLPLAVKQMGGLLRGKTVDEWKNIMRSEVWEVKEDMIQPVLRLSYDHLPSSDHKQCFVYCSLFPKAHVYEKNELVKLWMAQSFIRPHNRKRTEDIGSAYFKELSDRFFFERLTRDKDDGKYKMHDLIHDYAQTVSSPFCCQVPDTERLEPKVAEKSRHVSLLSKDVEQPTIEIISKANKLRTLLYPGQHLRTFGKVQYEIFKSLRYMRVLDLSSSTLLKLPDSIEELKLLHYLDLSKTEIKKLPESVCKLDNLETLKLLDCPWLLSLPKKLKNLVKLRHLDLDEMFWYKASAFPQGIGCLTSLHNLHKFQVGRDTGYKLEELNKMDYLTGTLHISKLENSENAVEANLKGKEMIEKVVYEWSRNASDVNLQDEATAKQVLEDLQPYSRVKELQICHYRGTDFPNWMKHGLLRNLVSISLNGCTRVKILTLGELNNLEELRLKNMPELEEWQGDILESLQKSLQTLKISNCLKLTKMPHLFQKLLVLKIKKCASLETLPVSLTSTITLVDNPVLKHWPEVTLVYDDQEVNSSALLLEVNIINCPELSSLPRDLRPLKLELSGCMSLRALPDQRCLGQLQVLALDACPDETLVSMIPGTESLYSLAVSNISNLICLPKWSSFPGLKALYISDCGDLEYLTNEENRTLFNGFTPLEILSIQKCPKLVTLPVEGLPSSLQVLIISSCARLKSFGGPDVLKNLTSLHDLYIEDCPALQSLPGDGLPSSLQHLSIQSCPSLIERCETEDGDLPKIEGIADREIKRSTKTTSS